MFYILHLLYNSELKMQYFEKLESLEIALTGLFVLHHLSHNLSFEQSKIKSFQFVFFMKHLS